jgi:hypothetical protein
VDQQREELYEAAIKSNDILYKAESVFPFSMFPDTITVDREKVSIANRVFFRVAQMHSIRIDDVLSVEGNVGPFFGSIRVTSKYFVKSPRVINYLTREDTRSIQKILQGYAIARQKEIDCSKIPTKELLRLLMELGEEGTD